MNTVLKIIIVVTMLGLVGVGVSACSPEPNAEDADKLANKIVNKVG